MLTELYVLFMYGRIVPKENKSCMCTGVRHISTVAQNGQSDWTLNTNAEKWLLYRANYF